MEVSRNYNTVEETFSLRSNSTFYLSNEYCLDDIKDCNEILKMVFNNQTKTVAFVDTNAACIISRDIYAMVKLASGFVRRANEILEKTKWFSSKEYCNMQMKDLESVWERRKNEIGNLVIPENMDVRVSVIDYDAQEITIRLDDSISVTRRRTDRTYCDEIVGEKIGLNESCCPLVKLVMISEISKLLGHFITKVVTAYNIKELVL